MKVGFFEPINRQEIEIAPCSYRLTTFERCTRGTLTAAEHSVVGEKLLGFIIQSSVVSVYAAELSDSGGQLCSSCFIPPPVKYKPDENKF